MVDLIMWIVIAVLLMAAAIQGVGYYQKAAYLYHMKSDLAGAGEITMSKVASDKGVLDKSTVDAGVADTKWSNNVSYGVETPTGHKPYIRAEHPGITDLDAIYLFESCGNDYPVGVSVIPKGSNPILEACGVSAVPPVDSGGGTVTAGYAGWGGNYSGEIGTGDLASSPYAKTAFTGALVGKTVTLGGGGDYHSCGISSGLAYCWGENGQGELGLGYKGGTGIAPTAVDATGAMAGLTVTQIATGVNYGYTCATAGGRAFCWGGSYYGSGSMGDGSGTAAYSPVAVNTSGVLAGKTVTEVVPSDQWACAIADGKPYCWGTNNYGQLGNGTTATSMVPVAVDTSGVLAGKTASNLSVTQKGACVIAGGQVYCWGDSHDGDLGNGMSYQETPAKYNSTTPVLAAGALIGKTVTKLSGGYAHCAIADGAAYCWGNGTFLGTGYNYMTGPKTLEAYPTAVDASGVLAGKIVTDIDSGDSSTCAIASGKAYCWGWNDSGELGNDQPADVFAASPMAVKTTGTVLDGKTITSMLVGGGSTIVSYTG